MKNNFCDWRIVNPDTQLDEGRLRMEVCLPWFRSQPLSVLAFSELDRRSINGEGRAHERATSASAPAASRCMNSIALAIQRRPRGSVSAYC